MKTRRDFLTNCSVLAAVAALEPTTLLSAPSFRRVPSLGQPGLSDWVPLVDTAFRLVRDGESDIRLRLTEAQGRLGARPSAAVAGDPGEHQFSLLFRARQDASLEQNTYTFEHAVLGRFAMFIVPVYRRDGNHCFYEAIFNGPPGRSSESHQMDPHAMMQNVFQNRQPLNAKRH